ncbi:TetR/AcrR family transcriptional regulator [Hephaestia sp. GCM10023244]|uniref:TetR/AcrR family transcriptional regulator n=1 Tax=unclassified Hephaestia TaxID=2631281 RepID=UPI00207774E8|nr:TetR/AcrR family transcriptional regulator [Hephaestia sp. MAHUQ-44]MCM8729804.1 TetR/AcrR family transcriptional regulator [Hephaestia sp. MAHUQ-44]
MTKVKKRAWGEQVPNRDERFELKRQVVLRTAARTYSQNGFHETTLADIADELNVSKPALYYYFRSKDDILFECHRLAIEAITNSDDPMPGRTDADGRSRLEEFLKRYVRMVVDDFGTCLVMTGVNTLEPQNRASVVEGHRQIDAMLRDILEHGNDDRTLLCPDPKISAMFIFGAMNWIPRWFHAEGSMTLDAVTAKLIDFVLRAIGPQPTG